MTLKDQQKILLTNLINQWYQNKYGAEWKKYTHKNMRPSPVKEWSQQFGVSVKDINELRMALVFESALGI